MHVLFSANPGHKTPHGYTVAFHLGSGPETPRRVVECANMKDVLAHWETFKTECDATGLSLVASFMQHPRDPARKLPGFNKASRDNHFTPTAAVARD